MAARIPLILSQPSRRDAAAIDLIENIVAAAMLVPGLDANLIGDIDTFESGGTDHLCLQGLTRDVVLASFLDLPIAQAAWARLGQAGHFVDFRSSADKIRSSQAIGRRVFYFQLSPYQRVADLLDRCQQLLAAQQLTLVSIGPMAGKTMPGQQTPGKPSPVRAVSLPIVNRAATESATSAGAVQALSFNQNTAAGVANHGAARTLDDKHSGATHDESDDWSQLDKLVDDLDAMDL